MNKIIINGTWGGQDIWREQTSGEKLIDALEEEKKNCNLCNGAKKVGDMNHNTDEEEIIVPCPECCKDYYESVDNNN